MAKNNYHFSIYDRGLTDITFQDKVSGFQFHHLNTHFTAHKGKVTVRTVKGKKVKTYSHDKARATQTRETKAYMAKLKRAFIGGDFNSSTYRDGFPRDIFKKGGYLGLRERGTVTNGNLSSFSTSTKRNYWYDDIFTRKNETVTQASLVKTNGVQGSTVITDHNWLKATIGFDAGALDGSATGPWAPPASTLPLSPPPKPTGNPWVASVRDDDYLIGAPIDFVSATLTDNYNAPSTLKLLGRTDQIQAALDTTYGLLLHDDHGLLRFSGPLVNIKKRGDGYCELTYVDDTVWLWYRKCYPVPGADWTTAAQTLAYDVVSGTSEARLLSLVNRNLGPAAPFDQPGLQPRRHPLLRLPSSLGRGPDSVQSVRFDSLGDVSASLAEQAYLRVQIKQTYTGTTPFLDLTLTDAPDLSDWVAFGTSEGGGPYMLTDGWSYEIDIPTGTTVLSAAGGEGKDRILTELTDGDAEDLWGARIELFLNQQGTTDQAEISNGMLKALADSAGPSKLSAPIGRVPGLGTTIPTGSQVAVVLDGEVIVDRIRQITTVLSNASNEPRVKTTGVIGDPSSGPQTPEQKVLARLLRRVQNLENM